MQSQDKYRIALLSAYAIVIHSFENILPSPVPWLRLGIANVITLVALMLYGFRAAMMVTLVRVVLSSLILGTFLGPGFILSLGGGISSTLAMGICFSLFHRSIGPIGLSLVAAFFHNSAQLLLAYIIFVQKLEPILMVSPLIMLLGTLTGVLNGFAGSLIIKNLLKKSE